MARIQVKVDQKAITRYFQTDPVPLGALRGVAEGLKAVAVEASPTGRSAPWPDRSAGPFNTRHGLFRASWDVRKYRTWYRVVNTDAFAWIVEYGAGRTKTGGGPTPAYAPMRRALRSVSGGKAVLYGKGQHADRRGYT
jgi:hypothetical protein